MDNIPALFDEAIAFENINGRNDRYEYAKVRKGNIWYFLKTARDKKLIPKIQREVVWSEFMNRIEAFYPSAHIFGPKVERRIGLSGIVFTNIDAPIVAERGDIEAWQRILPQYADMLALFDTVSVGWKSDNLPDEPSRSDHPYKIWEHWMGENIDRYPRMLEAKKNIESVHFILTKCLQHGDLTPWQIFDTKQGWIVFDGEKCGTDLFRFTDLAYGYVRLSVTYGSPAGACELLRLFIEKQDLTDEIVKKELLPVFLHRAVGGLSDAYRDNDEAAITRGEELLDACLDKDLSFIRG
ncbi:MAG: hypothetical protein ABIQ64_01185 [Candidatus Saccharimonadales bacterium]